MVRHKKENHEEHETKQEDPTAEKRAEMGDMRVPSQPLRPADIPPAPLTRSGYSEIQSEGDETQEEAS